MLLILALPGQSAEKAQVIRVIDGDSLLIAFSDGLAREARLSSIDAPEWNQAYGDQSTSSLKRLTNNQALHVLVEGTDDYQRLLIKAWLNCHNCPEAQDIALAQLELGMAWWYKRYKKEQAATDRVAYELAEATARKREIGLWQQVKPVAPWEWRRQTK